MTRSDGTAPFDGSGEGSNRGLRYSTQQGKGRYSPNIGVARTGVEPASPWSEHGVLPLDERAVFGIRRGRPVFSKGTASRSAHHSVDPLQDGSAITLSWRPPRFEKASRAFKAHRRRDDLAPELTPFRQTLLALLWIGGFTTGYVIGRRR